MVVHPRHGAIVGLMLLLGACATAPPGSTTTASPPSTATSAPTQTPQGTPSTASPAAPMMVTLYFGNSVLNPGSIDCATVYGVHRTVPASADALTAAMRELLAGPTPAEAKQGFWSWFSPATADSLISATASDTTSYVNLTDLRTIIPNASSSCGSAALLAQLGMTAQQAGMTPRVLYAIEGKPKTFWEWLQLGCDKANDNCDPAPFAG
ncbi:MAG: GerMN domain-containing protein [Propionicimonas sp.]